jgi:DNA/RNA endonuclease YhcR with UshA esterase domain
MNEKQLIKISLTVTLLGLLTLFFYADNFNLRVIENVDQGKVEETVKIQGEITKLSFQDKVAFIEIEGQQVIKTEIVLFNDREIYLKEGDFVQIIGEVEEYNNKKEIIANKIVKK